MHAIVIAVVLYLVSSDVEGLQGDEKEANITFVFKRGAVCLGLLQEEKANQFIPVSYNICILLVSKKTLT